MADKMPGLVDRPAVEIVDLERYPIAGLDSAAGQALVASCRQQLAGDGACNLRGFLTAEATVALAAEAQSLAHLGYRTEDTHSVYLEANDPAFPEDHPRNLQQHTAKAGVAYDHIPPEAGIRRLYEWDALLDFVRVVLDKDELHLHGDPLGALNIMVFDSGGQLGWHFDRSDFVVTLMLQAAEGGGTFDYVPDLRSPDDENYGGVARLLSGDSEGVVSLSIEPGTLAFFRGHYSIHRVSAVEGQRQRLNAVLSYAEYSGALLNEYTRRKFYGRTV